MKVFLSLNNVYSHEKLVLFSLSLFMAIGGIYSYKIMSILLPVVTLCMLWVEGGIKNISLPYSPPLIFSLLLLSWMGVSIFWTENQIEAIKVFIPLILTFAFSVIFFSCIIQATPNLISKAYDIVKYSGFFLILFIICQIGIDTVIEGFFHYNKFSPYMLRMKPTGSILALTIFVGCAFLWTYKNKFFAIFSFLIIFLLIILTICQTAIYSVVISTIVFFLSYLMPFWITRIGMIASYTCLLLCPLLYTYILSSTDAAQSIYLKWIMTTSFYHRWLAWEFFSNKFFEKPLWGWGVEASRYIQTAPVLAPGYSNVLHPHNNSIQAYVELGLIGGILFALFFSSIFYLVEKHVKDRFSIAVCNATITSGFIGAFITHNAWRNYWLSLIVLIAGLIILLIKTREVLLHVSAGHLKQRPTL